MQEKELHRILSSILDGRSEEEVLSWRKEYKRLLNEASKLQCNVLLLTGDLSRDLKCPSLVLQRILSFLDGLARFRKSKDEKSFDVGLISYIAKIGLPAPDVIASAMRAQRSTVSFTDYSACLDYVNFAVDFSEINDELLSNLIIRLSQLAYLYPVGDQIESVEELLKNPVNYLGSLYRQALLVQLYKRNFDKCCIKNKFGFSPLVPVAPVPIILSNSIIEELLTVLPDVPTDKINKLLEYGYNIFAGRLAGMEIGTLDTIRRIDTSFPVGYGVIIDSDCIRFVFDTSGASYCIELNGRYSLGKALFKIEQEIDKFSKAVSRAVAKFEDLDSMAMVALNGIVAIRTEEGDYYEVLLSDLISAIFPAKTFQQSVEKFVNEKTFSQSHLKKFMKNIAGGKLVAVPKRTMAEVVALLTSLELKFSVVGNYPLSPSFSNKELLWAYNLLLHRVRKRIGEMNFALIHKVLHKFIAIMSSSDMKAYLSSDFPGFVKIELYLRLPVLVRKKTQWFYEKRWYHVSLSGLPPFSKVSIDNAIPELSSAPSSFSYDVSLQSAASWSGLDLNKFSDRLKQISSYFEEVKKVLDQVDQIPILFRLKLSKGEAFSFADLGDLVIKIHQ